MRYVAPACSSVPKGIAGVGLFGIGGVAGGGGQLSMTSRRAFARRRIPRVREIPTQIAPCLTELDPLAAAGAMVFDCRPQVLPGAMDLSGLELVEICSTTRASAAPNVSSHLGGGGDLLELICPELGVTALVDPGTDCEDELPDTAGD